MGKEKNVLTGLMGRENRKQFRLFNSKLAFYGFAFLLSLLIFVIVLMANDTIGEAFGETWKFVLDVLLLLTFLSVVFFGLLFGANAGGKLTEKNPKKAAIASNVLMVIGAIGLCTGAVGSAIGIFRGYSVQSLWGIIAIISGAVCFVIAGMFKRVYLISFASLFMVLFFGALSRQGHNYMRGEWAFIKGDYSQAAERFLAETQTWYFRLVYNPSESKAMESLAKTYCKLGQKDKARETYMIIIKRYPGLTAQRAEQMLEEMKSVVDNPNAL